MKLIEKDGPFPFQEQTQAGSTKFVLDVNSVDLRNVAMNKEVVLVHASNQKRSLPGIAPVFACSGPGRFGAANPDDLSFHGRSEV